MDSAQTQREKTEQLLNSLMAFATNGTADNDEYRNARRDLLDDPRIAQEVPYFVRTCRDLAAFEAFMKERFAKYKERRAYLRQEFEPVLAILEALERGVPAETLLETGRVDSDHVRIEWDKAVARVTLDPPGAITSARTLVEAVCKHILAEADVQVSDRWDLPKLYAMTAKLMNLAPEQHAEDAFRTILGGCTTTVNGLAALRNRLGDAHGPQARSLRAAPRHARLAVNVAGAVAMFLIETWEARLEAAAASARGSTG